MVSAITTASSVCGCCTVRRMTTTARIAAPATIPKATYLPSARRRSLISAAEDEEPCGEDPDTGKARVDQCRGANVGRDLHRDEHLPGENGEHDPDDDADQPRREERAQDVDGRRHAAAGEREEDGDPEPVTSLPVTAVEAWPSKMAGEPRATRGPDGRGRQCRAGFEHGHPVAQGTSRSSQPPCRGQCLRASEKANRYQGLAVRVRARLPRSRQLLRSSG